MRTFDELIEYLEFSVDYWRRKMDSVDGASDDYIRYCARFSESSSILQYILEEIDY